MKTCQKCGALFDTKDCLACARTRTRKYVAEHKEKAKATTKKWRDANPEKVKAMNARALAKRRLKNIEEVRAKARKYSATSRQRYPESGKLRVAEWRKKHPESARIFHHNRLSRKRINGGVLSKDLAARLFKLQRGKCACGCGQELGSTYHLDHRMPIALGGTNTDDNMQLLTKRCNLQKHAKHPVEFMQERGFLL